MHPKRPNGPTNGEICLFPKPQMNKMNDFSRDVFINSWNLLCH